ncbi:MAG: alcohol dehydrogenase catalytic domain-containing protein [Chloroflexota bacterium]|nr:alcohol dehydrogenase catalytic domain-containing protein [Chloroflexota bacterium]
MKAMVLQQFNEPLVETTLPDPSHDENEIIIQVKANGLCATDLKIISGVVPTVSVPHVQGHEVSGEVVSVGAKVPGLVRGDRVTVYPTRSCGFCDYCRLGMENYCSDAPRTGFEIDGGFSDYMCVLGRNAVKISHDLPFELAAIIPDAMATAYHALVQKAKAQVGETVVVVGLGGLGIHTVQLAALLGSRVIAVDVEPDKIAAASEYGADETINALHEDVVDRVKDLTGGSGADVVIEGVGGEAVPKVLADCFKFLKLGGRLVVMGYAYDKHLTVDTADLIYGQWNVLGTRASNLQDVVETVRLVESGLLKPVVSQRFSLFDANNALNMLEKSPPLGRIVLVSP